MAKRISPNEKVFNPVEEALVRSALGPINAELERADRLDDSRKDQGGCLGGTNRTAAPYPSASKGREHRNGPQGPSAKRLLLGSPRRLRSFPASSGSF